MSQKKTSRQTSRDRRAAIGKRAALWGVGSLLLIAGELAAVPINGVYSGTTSQGKQISITVSGGNITSYALGWSCGGSSGTTTVNTSCPVGGGNSFSCGSSSCSFVPFGLSVRIAGAFSGESVSGTLNLSFYPCTFGCSCCSATGITYSASLPMPEVSIGDVTVTEGDSGTTAAQFEITRNFDSGGVVTVDWTTSNGTADSSDYAPTSGTVIFGSGELSKTASVSVFGDTDVEPDETFFIDLSNPSNITIADGQGQCTIVDDDAVPMTMLLAIGGFKSVDELDDVDNDVLIQYMGSGAVITGIGWDVEISTVGASWLSEARMYFDGSDQDGTGLFLTPGAGDDFSGTGSYSSPLIDLTDNGIPDIPILTDGNLYVQFFEDFDDVPGSVDATFVTPSTLTIEFLPSPDFIFADGFESGDIAAWSSSSGVP